MEPASFNQSEELRQALITLGRGLGVVAVYGKDHPAVDLAIDQTFDALQKTLQKTPSVTLGTVNGVLAVNSEPFIIRDAPVRALEKKLLALNISQLTLNKNLPRHELKQLFFALCASSDTAIKDLITDAGLEYIKISEVKYVALNDGEADLLKSAEFLIHDETMGAGRPASPDKKIKQLSEFLTGNTGDDDLSLNTIKLLSDPEKWVEAMMQTASDLQEGALADVVLTGLRRTYNGLRKEPEYNSAWGKSELAKIMRQIEERMLDQISNTPDSSRRILEGLQKMEAEQHLDLLSAHCTEQYEKQSRAEEKLIEFIKKVGVEEARAQLAASGLPFPAQQRLMLQSAGALPAGSAEADHIIEKAVERLEQIRQMNNPEQAQASVVDTRRGINTFNTRMLSQIEDLENKIQQGVKKGPPDRREKLLLEISKLSLSLMQPLTVVNGSIEAALTTTNEVLRRNLLDMAYQSGQSLDAMTKRMIALTGYPELNEADSHLADWNPSL